VQPLFSHLFSSGFLCNAKQPASPPTGDFFVFYYHSFSSRMWCTCAEIRAADERLQAAAGEWYWDRPHSRKFGRYVYSWPKNIPQVLSEAALSEAEQARKERARKRAEAKNRPSQPGARAPTLARLRRSLSFVIWAQTRELEKSVNFFFFFIFQEDYQTPESATHSDSGATGGSAACSPDRFIGFGGAVAEGIFDDSIHSA
jgi:hypothetical protein